MDNKLPVLLIILFFALVVPLAVISIRRLTVWLLIKFRFFKPGELYAASKNYLSGAGHNVNRICYLTRKNGSEEIVNFKVYLYLNIISVSIAAIMLIIFLVFSK